MRIRSLFRFSLRTLLLFVLAIVCAAATWHNREPWFLAQEFPVPRNSVWSYLRMLPNGEDIGVLLTDGSKSELAVWSVKTGETRRSQGPLPGGFVADAGSPSARLSFVACNVKKQAAVCDAGHPESVCTIPEFEGGKSFSISVNGRRVACVGTDQLIRVTDLETRRTTSLGPVQVGQFAWLEFSADGRWLSVTQQAVSAPYGFQPWLLYDCDKGVEVKVPHEVLALLDLDQSAGAGSLRFFGRGQLVYVGRHRWDPETGRLETMPGVPLKVPNGCCPPSCLIFRSTPELVEVWRVDLSERIGAVRISAECEYMTPTPTGDRLVTRAPNPEDASGIVWDVRSGRAIGRIPYGPELRDMEFFADADHLISMRYSESMTLEVWQRRRPEFEWGVLAQIEFYLLVLCAAGLLWSIWSDVRRL